LGQKTFEDQLEELIAPRSQGIEGVLGASKPPREVFHAKVKKAFLEKKSLELVQQSRLTERKLL
jgi:hypothetical protein